LLSFAIACQVLSPTEEPTTVPIQTLPTQPQSNSVLQSESQVPRIGVSEAKAAVDSGQAILVDVRRVDSYNNSHAEGAVSIPLERFESNIAGIPLEKSQWIITYCT
jgi:3-mercaptopyruvate sulfurtransferase SseA